MNARHIVAPRVKEEEILLANMRESRFVREYFGRMLNISRRRLTNADGDEILRYQGATRLLTAFVEAMDKAHADREKETNDA